MHSDFPRPADAPPELAGADACGPLAAWQVLRHFGRDVQPAELLGACRFDAAVGAYAIGVAVALARAGLAVQFFTDPDDEVQPAERELYAEAQALGIAVRPALALAELCPLLDDGSVAVVLYEAAEGEPHGHFTPVLGVWQGEVVAPNEGDGLSASELEERRRRPGILRQCVVASAAPVA